MEKNDFKEEFPDGGSIAGKKFDGYGTVSPGYRKDYATPPKEKDHVIVLLEHKANEFNDIINYHLSEGYVILSKPSFNITDIPGQEVKNFFCSLIKYGK
jgi:hypothetical protein